MTKFNTFSRRINLGNSPHFYGIISNDCLRLTITNLKYGLNLIIGE